MSLSTRELARYDRHLKLPQVGLEGQEKLRRSSVLLIGAGGLGSPIALYLAAAGVGRIGIIDHDVVDLSNLQRQILHSSNDIGRAKVESARERLTALNPDVEVVAYQESLSADNALALIDGYDVVADGSDNFTTRYLVNDACVIASKANVHGSIYRFEGQASVFMPGGPCYRCLFPAPPPPGAAPSCEEAGVLGVLPGIIGTIQANETIKLILGLGRTLAGRLLVYDALEMRFRELAVERNRECAVCGEHPTIKNITAESWQCTAPQKGTMTPGELKAKLEAAEEFLLVDVREPHEWNAGHLENALHIPLGSIEERIGEIDRDRNIVVYCRSGARSARAVAALRSHGYERVSNLEEGILGWARINGKIVD